MTQENCKHTQRDENAWWQAVVRRDVCYDGVFTFGVRSTGIYCRPGCPSRRPRWEQVQFFATTDEAEEAGFRPCKRCRPNQPLHVAPQVELALLAAGWLEAHAGQRVTLKALGEAVGSSPYHLQRAFKSVMGVTPRQYAAQIQVQQFKGLLKEGEVVAAASFQAGFGSSSRVYEQGKERLGMTPGTYRRKGQDMQIQYVIVDSPLGRMLVGATHKGICALSFGDQDEALEAFLKAEYPAAVLQTGDEGFQPWVDEILQHLEGVQPNLDLPLDVRATAFQMRVWEALRKIPYGETRTYSEVAVEISRPAAVRAVASACAANPVSVVTPCHRVVRSDGGLGGYRWGLERKQALLEKEKKIR
jgi:AraC family transcriptional regulator of adaptative response/methylated-DNA-[protein]-cysteine methyltransferase